jgi:hypothetical protein
MAQQELAQLTDEELLQEAKKNKFTKLTDGLFIGLLLGIAVYSAVEKGFGLLTFLPLIYLPIAARNRIKNKAMEDLLKERNLK